MKKTSLFTLLIALLGLTSIFLTGCESDWFRKIDPRNDDSISYHNKFVEHTNKLLEKTKAVSDEYTKVLTQVEKAEKILEYAELKDTLNELEKTQAEAVNDINNATSKDAKDEDIYLKPFQSVYIPSISGIEKEYKNLVEYLDKEEGKYDIKEFEALSVKIDSTYQAFINDHNVFIDQINSQVK